MRLFGETLAPVAHPSLCEQSLEHPEQISEYFLLEFDDQRRSHLQWASWLSAMGWTGAKSKGVLRFNQYDQVIQAAVAGQGVAVGRLELLGTMLAERRLVALSKPWVAEHLYAHWLIKADADPREDVLDVITWVRSQVSEMELGELWVTAGSHTSGSSERGKKVV
jgi:DNA-binding transcriptional LysR family regulator